MGAVITNTEPGGGGSEGIGIFFKAVSQAVLMFGEEMWVLTPRMEQALDRFHHKVARRLTGRQPRRRGGGGSWDYPPL